jgi:hypothetical protein
LDIRTAIYAGGLGVDRIGSRQADTYVWAEWRRRGKADGITGHMCENVGIMIIIRINYNGGLDARNRRRRRKHPPCNKTL